MFPEQKVATYIVQQRFVVNGLIERGRERKKEKAV